MSHFWEDFLSGFFSVSMIMIPVTCWGSWPLPLDNQRMVTWDDVSFKSWLNEVRNRRTYAVAVVVEVQDLKGNSGLGTLASLKLGAGSEGCVSELRGN
jgi:hypothetical protein